MLEAATEISPTTKASTAAAAAAKKIGRARRWKLVPPACAATISECRLMAPSVKTVAKKTEAGMTIEISSGST